MASKRIDELTTRSVVNTDLLPPTPTGGPSGSATVAATVKAGLVQPNSASAGAGADVTVKAADGVTSGAGGSIIIQSGAQATTGGNGSIILRPAGGTSGYDQLNCTYTASGNIIKLTHQRQVTPPYTTSAIQLESEYFYHANSLSAQQYTIRANYQAINFFQLTSNFSGDFYFRSSSSGQGDAYFGMRSNTAITWSSDANGTTNGVLSLDCPQSGILRIANGVTYKSTGSGSIAIKPVVTNISANTNDLALNAGGIQKLNCTSASELTGVAPPSGTSHVDGRMIKIFNVGTANLTLKHNSTSSSAANRMFMSTSADVVLAANGVANLVYDSTDNGSGAAGWRVY